MALAESWHVRSRSRECAATERAFADGEAIVTALFPDPESSGYLRRDYCVDAWESREADADKPFSFWKSTFTAPNSNKEEDPVEKLSPEEILQRLVEEDEEHTENTRYILAVMLERKKLLRETDSQRTPNGILRVYEHRKTGEVFLVRDPDLPLDQIEAVQEEVFILLENNGRMPEPEPETESPSETGPGDEAPEDPDGDEPSEPETAEADTPAGDDASETLSQEPDDPDAPRQSDEADGENPPQTPE